MSRKRKSRTFLSLVPFIAISLALVAIVVTSGAAAPPPGDEEFGVIAEASNAFMNSNPVNYINSPALMALLDDNSDGVIDGSDNPSNDPLVIDVRSAADYAGNPGVDHGHIPGAINVPYKDIDKPANLALINGELAKHSNKTIVLACYTGHTDKLAEMALGAVARAGYFGIPAPTVTALKWGNLEWNTAAEPGEVPAYSKTYAVETTDNPLPAASGYPVVENTASTDPAEITRVAADASLQLGPHIFPGTAVGQVNDINDGNPANGDYIGLFTVVDLRSPAEYAAGHIIGAVNIPYQQLFDKDIDGNYTNMLKVDRSKPIIVYDNSQQEGNNAIIGMNALGIRNAGVQTKNLRYGLAFWNSGYGTQYNPAVDNHSYPVIYGSAPGGPTYAASCTGIKPSIGLSAPTPYWVSFADYTARLLSVDWKISNPGANIAYDVAITGSTNTNGVTVATTLPVTVANIMSMAGTVSPDGSVNPDGWAIATLKYNVPVTTGSWHTTTNAGSQDICGNSYVYP